MKRSDILAVVVTITTLLGGTWFIGYTVAVDGVCKRPLPHQVEACERLRR